MCITEISRISEAYLSQCHNAVTESTQEVRHVKAVKNEADNVWKLVDEKNGETIQSYGILDDLKKDVKDFGYLLTNEHEVVAEKTNDEFHFVKCSKCGTKLCKETDTYRFDSEGKPLCYDCANADESCSKKECTKTIKASAAIPMLMEEDKVVSESSGEFRIYFEEEPIDVLRKRCWECDDLYNKIQENGVEEDFNALASEMFPEGAGMTEFNDWCRFETDSILQSLGIEDEEEEDEDDEEMSVDEKTEAERAFRKSLASDEMNANALHNAARANLAASRRLDAADPAVIAQTADANQRSLEKAAKGEYGTLDSLGDEARIAADNTRAVVQKHPLSSAAVAAGLGAAATAGVVALNNRRRRKRGL